MTQAFNLSQFANKVNTSGQASLTTAVTGTLPVANGGTGITSAGSNGNVLTSNGTAWVSSAPPAGGVTSLNGQTGAITNTSLYAIGSYITGRPQNGTTYAVDSTIAGSSLYSSPSGSFWNTSSTTWQGYNTTGSNANLSASGVLINTGTWRCVSPSASAGSAFYCGLWVRIS
jgi:hypothetical protein